MQTESPPSQCTLLPRFVSFVQELVPVFQDINRSIWFLFSKHVNKTTSVKMMLLNELQKSLFWLMLQMIHGETHSTWTNILHVVFDRSYMSMSVLKRIYILYCLFELFLTFSPEFFNLNSLILIMRKCRYLTIFNTIFILYNFHLISLETVRIEK